jgi:hypothetical protein
MGFVTLGGMTTDLFYTNFVNSGSFEKIPVWAAISEGSDVAILGLVKHLSYGYGMATNSVSTVSGSAAFGNATPLSIKLLVPWSGSYPGYLRVRTGRTMNFDTPGS